ncbi:MAG TPA: N-acetylgalactosamine-6-sulfatase [Verrucomicrobiales bacterium]|nr:N-acetylgalactosamine-6-sulfatase [Verrucomicrobiales bacterium]HRJ07807.1 sulfatase-like hydrolase/transferase [Prosthecobacter sp.]HRK13680.1 sulfatase-like hydrolase/transferase [Prosthecobacter sp.]
MIARFTLSLLAAASLHAAPPNVVLIVSDDQGWPDLGCIGSKPVQTPNLDKLAERGVRGTSFYVTWPACTPSRGSLLTGRYPQRNGLYDMVRNDMVNYGHRYKPEEYAVSPEMTLGLDPREITIGDMLRKAGYVNGVVGKWDMGQAKRYLPLQRGFDFFYGHGNNGIDYYTHERYGTPSLFRGNQRTEEDKGKYATEVFRREALYFVNEHAGRNPFFLYLPFNAPHGASTLAEDNGGQKPGVQAPEEYKARFRDIVKDEKLAGYYGAVTCMDDAIGAVMDAVEKAGQTKNTIWIFMSDNGGSGNGGNAPLKGSKSTMWEGGLRVPFIFVWPGRAPAGKVTDEFLTALEIVPTLLAATGAPAPEGVVMDGFDMLPVLRGEMKSPRGEMFWQRRGDKAARIGQWKWLESAKGRGLYDLSTDLGESEDLSEEKPEVLEMMREKFAAWRKTMDEAEPRGPFRDY